MKNPFLIYYFLYNKLSLPLDMKNIWKYLIITILFFSPMYSNVNYLGAINLHSQYIFRGKDIVNNSPIIKPELGIILNTPNIWCNTMFTESLSKTNFQEFKIMFGYTKNINDLHEFELRTIYSTYPSMNYNSAYDIYLKYFYKMKIPILIDANYNFENEGLYSSIKSSFFFDFFVPWIIETSLGYNINSYDQFNHTFSQGFSDFNTTLLSYIELNKINIESSIKIIYPFTDNNKVEILLSLYFDYIF